MMNISNLGDCIKTLKKASVAYRSIDDKDMKELIGDAYIQRFEYTLEIAWKTMKRYLKQVHGKEDKDLTVNNIFRMMENYEFIRSWETWRKYYEYRNNTSHEYDQGKALELINKIEGFIEECEYFYAKLSEALALQ